MTLFKCYKNKDLDYAAQIAGKLAGLIDLMFCVSNPIPVKHMLALQSLIQPNFRLPLCPMSKLELESFEKKLKSLGWL